ncbi:MAG: ABC transporter ATP-binding protein [Dehalococcoidia bacterium]|nr:ABC transporter ATP-binding protein [Dehalococcoidia bacterium]
MRAATSAPGPLVRPADAGQLPGTSPRIVVEGLGKRYRRGAAHRRESLKERLGEILGLPGPRRDEDDGQFWALRGVGFSAGAGEAIGVIGRNGSGKSTLLRLLARVTAPTEGSACLHGTVGALLEAGAGFHDELTGRENVFLSGAILGMRRKEVASRFDDIVAFAEVGPWLDSPMKQYSSGMYLRLAFSIGVHMESDILLADEVLAVGDLSCQDRCLRRMEEAARSGRTVLLVSHNLESVARLCPRTIYLDGGRLKLDGPTEQVVAAYRADLATGQVGEDPSHVAG